MRTCFRKLRRILIALGRKPSRRLVQMLIMVPGCSRSPRVKSRRRCSRSPASGAVFRYASFPDTFDSAEDVDPSRTLASSCRALTESNLLPLASHCRLKSTVEPKLHRARSADLSVIRQAGVRRGTLQSKLPGFTPPLKAMRAKNRDTFRRFTVRRAEAHHFPPYRRTSSPRSGFHSPFRLLSIGPRVRR